MPASQPLETRKGKGPLALLLTTTGVVALSALIAAAGGVFLLYSQFGPTSVTVIEVTADVQVNATDTAEGALRADPLRLPHCSAAWLQASPRQLTVAGNAFDHTVETVVLVHYAAGPSFSNGGDDAQVVFLHHGEHAAIAAAYNVSTVLYRIEPGGAVPIQPVAAQQLGPRALAAHYVVNGTLGHAFGPPRPDGNFIIDESHALAQWDAVPVVARGRTFCA